MDDFGMTLGKQWHILFNNFAAENPMPKSKAHFVSFEFDRFEHSTIMVAKVEGFNKRN